jgi:hydrogenase nickel incorporation protein HypA/HybF
VHELAVAVGLVRQVQAAARERAPGRRVTAIEVELGELSAVVPEFLRSAFPLAAEGTGLDGAALCIRRVAAQFACRSCAARFAPGGTACPQCGGTDVELVAGREIFLVSIEVEDQPEAKGKRR